MHIARWFMTNEAECLQEDGVRNYSPLDFAELSHVDLFKDHKHVWLKATKRVEDELLDAFQGEPCPRFIWTEKDGLSVCRDEKGAELAVLKLTKGEPK